MPMIHCLFTWSVNAQPDSIAGMRVILHERLTVKVVVVEENAESWQENFLSRGADTSLNKVTRPTGTAQDCTFPDPGLQALL